MSLYTYNRVLGYATSIGHKGEIEARDIDSCGRDLQEGDQPSTE